MCSWCFQVGRQAEFESIVMNTHKGVKIMERIKETKKEKALRITAMAINVITEDLERLDEHLDQDEILNLMYYQGKFEIIRDLLKE